MLIRICLQSLRNDQHLARSLVTHLPQVLCECKSYSQQLTIGKAQTLTYLRFQSPIAEGSHTCQMFNCDQGLEHNLCTCYIFLATPLYFAFMIYFFQCTFIFLLFDIVFLQLTFTFLLLDIVFSSTHLHISPS